METRIMTLVSGAQGPRWDLLQAPRESLKGARTAANTLAEHLPESCPESEAARDVAESISRLLRLLGPRVAEPAKKQKKRFRGNAERQLPPSDRLTSGD